MRVRLATEPLKTQKVYLLLRDRIAGGYFSPGSRLPGEPALANLYSVSRVTIRRALDRLAAEHLIDKRPGSGTFVRDVPLTVSASITDVANVFSHLIEMGKKTDVRVLAFDYVTPFDRVRDALGLELDERVQKSVRVRLVDGEPFSYLTAQVPERIGRTFSQKDLDCVPLLELIERSGHACTSATQEIGAVLAAPEVAEALDLSVGSALVSLTRIVHGPDGEGLEHLHALYRPDRYSLQMQLIRKEESGRRHWSPTARPLAHDSLRSRRTRKKA
jgi:GntR family transcriptional regulator